eukprot:1311998-Lingulodinium_polyedra.AAC.1
MRVCLVVEAQPMVVRLSLPRCRRHLHRAPAPAVEGAAGRTVGRAVASQRGHGPRFPQQRGAR